MSQRGQFSIEMFFAFTFAILLVFWFINYIDLYSSTADRVPVQVTQRIIAKDLVKIVNSVCAFSHDKGTDSKGIRVIFQMPCLQQKRDSLFYNLTVLPDKRTLTVFNGISNFTASVKANCDLEVNANLSRCTTNAYFCIYKDMGLVSSKVVLTDEMVECL